MRACHARRTSEGARTLSAWPDARLAGRAPEGRTSSEAAASERRATARTHRIRPIALTGKPPGASRDAPSTDRPAQRRAHHPVQPRDLLVDERRSGAPRVDATAPQHLVAQHVAEASEDGLIHQDDLDGTPSSKPTGETRTRDIEHIGTLSPRHSAHVSAPFDEAETPKLPDVPRAQLAAANQKHHPILPILRSGLAPDERAGHTEVHDQTRTVGRQPEPLPRPPRARHNPTPSSAAARSAGPTLRSTPASRTRTVTITAPTKCRSTRRRKPSTSGSSGIGILIPEQRRSKA